MRFVVYTLVVLLAASMGWRYRAVIGGWLAPPPTPQRPVVFDNGSVRDVPLPASPSAQATQSAPGVMRKCVKSGETSYTNFTCPPGFKEAAISNDRFTVVAGTPKAQPAGPKNAEAPSALHEALDLKRDDELKRRVMERAMEGAEK